MKHLSLLAMAALALAACKEAKDPAAADPASAKPSKKDDRPARPSATANEDLPYPEGLKLIGTAEKTGRALGSLMTAHKDLLSPDLAGIIGQANRQPPPPATPEAERAKAEVAEARKAHIAAMLAVARYEGTAFEEEQIKAFQQRQGLRNQVAALEGRLKAAASAADPATEDSLQSQLKERKKTLEEMDAAWNEISTGGWRDHVVPGSK